MSAERIHNLIAAFDEAMRIAGEAIERNSEMVRARPELVEAVDAAAGMIDVDIDRVARELEGIVQRARLTPEGVAQVSAQIDRAIEAAEADARAVATKRAPLELAIGDWAARATTVSGALGDTARERVSDYQAQLADVDAELAEYLALADDLRSLRRLIAAKT